MCFIQNNITYFTYEKIHFGLDGMSVQKHKSIMCRSFANLTVASRHFGQCQANNASPKYNVKQSGFIKLQFSSYQLTDIYDSLSALDCVLSKVSDLVSLERHLYSGVKANRCFIDLARSAQISTGSKLQKAPQSTKLITVIRSVFVFKKTREQFAQTKYSYYVTLKHNTITGFREQLITSFSTARFPAELKITVG